jgi:hypothetical protein
VDQDLLSCCRRYGFFGSFDQFAGFEACACTDECDQMRRVHRTPTILRGFDQLFKHDSLFASVGVNGEGIARYGMVALSVPPEADLLAVKRMLKYGETSGWARPAVGGPSRRVASATDGTPLIRPY